MTTTKQELNDISFAFLKYYLTEHVSGEDAKAAIAWEMYQKTYDPY